MAPASPAAAAAPTTPGNVGNGISTAFNFDDTNPTVTVTPARAADYAGWYNAPVVFDTAGSDSTSGVSDANCSLNYNYTGPDGTGLTRSGSCTDNAGNVGNGISTAFKFDDTNPTVALVGGPANGASYYFGSVPAVPTCTASDATSGVAGSCAVSGYLTTVGTHSVAASASEQCGKQRH
jgi:hypothetical protein